MIMLILCKITKLRILYSIFIFKLEYPNRKVDIFKHVENLFFFGGIFDVVINLRFFEEVYLVKS